MKKFMKKSEGFTLVELIIVIVILGILAVVAIPAYTGYITKANEAADIAACDAIKTAASAACAKDGAVTSVEVEITTSGETTTTTVKANNNDITTNADFVAFYAGNTLPTAFKQTGMTTATWTASANKWSFS